MKMIVDFLPELLRINLVTSIVILIILGARLVLKRAPKVFSYALWAIVLIRLLIPVSIQSPISVVPNTPAASGAVINSALPEIEFETLSDLEQNYYESQNTSSDDVQVYVSRTMEPIVYLSLAWLVGVAVMVLYSGISYLKIRRMVRIAVPLRENIWIADDIKSPFVISFIKPKIYLPNNLGEQEQEYIILHEQHHIRRFDHVIKALAFLALTIHWFNPLVWIAFVLACKDMEMSCDEAVIRKLGSDVRADYSASLLTLATGHRIIAGTPLAFGEGDTKGRIKNLAKWKKPAIWVLVLTIIICLILGLCLLTDRVSRQNKHVGTTFYYGNVTEQGEGLIEVLCNDGTNRVFYYEAGNDDIPADLTGKQVEIRARIQEVTGNLFTSRVSQVPDTRFDTLEKAIQNAILSHHSHRQDQEILDCASFFTYSSEGRSPAGSNKVDLVTEYGIVYHQGYRLEGGKLVEDGGCNVPTVLTFRVDDDGQYILAEYWEPRDGNLYPEDIKAKYPAFVWPDTQKNLFEQKIAVFSQAMEGFNVGPEVIIDHLITDICDRERWAPGFADLMTMCETQREILSYYGRDTLVYCFNQFGEGNQDDLRGQVMAYVCSDILESMGQKPVEGWSWQRSGQDWFDAFTQDTPNWQQFLLQGYSQNISFASVELEGDNDTITQIDLHNGHNGQHTYITDPESIEAIIHFMSSVSGNNPTSSKGYYGWTYSLKFMSGDTEILSMGFGDDETFNYGTYTDGYPCRYELKGITLMDAVSFLCQFDESDHEWGSRYVYPSVNWGIQLNAENVTSSGLTLVVTQDGTIPDGILTTGQPYFIQKKENNNWIPLEPLLEAWGWTTEAWIISMNDTARWDVSWEWLFGKLQSGQYRIGKDIYLETVSGNREQAVYYVEFEIP